MDSFIATKPVRFDKNYAVGEAIPDAVIHPKNVKRLIDQGKIQRIPAHDDLFNSPEVEDILGYIEAVLDIDHGAEPPEVDVRAEAIKARIAELTELAEKVKAAALDPQFQAITEWNEAGTPEDGPDGPGDGEPDAPETPQDDAGGEGGTDTPTDPENAQDGQRDAPEGDAGAAAIPANVKMASMTTQTGDGEQPQGDPPEEPEGENCECVDKAGYPDATCPVCGRIMGSKGALTNHMRKEHPDYNK